MEDAGVVDQVCHLVALSVDARPGVADGVGVPHVAHCAAHVSTGRAQLGDRRVEHAVVHVDAPHPSAGPRLARGDRPPDALRGAGHQDAIGYLIEALLQWALFDPSCPDPVPPSPATGHLELLKQIAVRWSERTAASQTVSRILGMGQVGRKINYAIRCECDPQGLRQRDVVAVR